MFELPKSAKAFASKSQTAYVIRAGCQLYATTPGNAPCKFAVDTYLIMPASNEHSRLAEIANIHNWALLNNLKLNSNKSREILLLTTGESGGTP